MSAIGTRLLKIKIGGTEVTAEVTSCKVSADDLDPITFAEAAGGKKAWKLKFTAVQNPETTSLWYQLWSLAGSTVAVIVNPNGVATATATTPFLSGNCIISIPNDDMIGGDVDSSALARQTFNAEWEFTAQPTLVTTGSF